MALQATIFVKGRIGNTTFYPLGDTWVARSLPAHVKQAAATKLRSRNFGIAAKAGKILRQLLLPSLPFPKDKKMQTRFTGAIAQWLGINNVSDLEPAKDLPYVNDFSFNEHTSIAERWKSDIIILRLSDELMTLNIPSFIPTEAISAPAHTKSCECIFTVASCKLADATSIGSLTISISIPYDSVMRAAQIISLPVSTPAGAIVVTTTSLSYQLTSGQKDMRPSFMPCSVIDARYC